jgi:GntR family transcriptional regulator
LEVLLTDTVGQPAYQQVAADLRKKISSGEYPVGGPIPSTNELRRRYAVSVTVARAAVAELRNEGVVRGQPGKAVYVVATPASVKGETIDLSAVRRSVDSLSRKVTKLDSRLSEAPDALEAVQQDLRDLRRQTARIETHLMDLYAKMGQAYPHKAMKEGRSRRSGGRAANG